MYTHDGLVASDYEGWVAWAGGTPKYIDGNLTLYEGSTPFFEKVASARNHVSLTDGVSERAIRPEDKRTVEWDDLPHKDLVQVQLYAFRDVYPNQPVVTITKQPNRDLRFIQYKRSGMIVGTASLPKNDPELKNFPGQRRLGVTGWYIGYWDRTVGRSEIWMVPRDPSELINDQFPKKDMTGANHICWPRPLGFGLGPQVVGMKPEDIPPPPMELQDSGIILPGHEIITP